MAEKKVTHKISSKSILNRGCKSLIAKLFSISLFAGVVSANTALSQTQNVGIGTDTPDQSAILELNSNIMGFLAPRMTTVQRSAIPSPATGLLVFNTTTGNFEYNSGTPASPSWTPILSSSSTIPFSSIVSGTNTGAAMIVGTGASLVLAGTGRVESSAFKGSGSSSDAVDLQTSEVAGTLPVANGGTGLTSVAQNSLLSGNASSGISAFASSSNSYLSTDASGNLTWQSLPSGGFLSGTGSANQIPFYSAASTLTGSANLTWNNATSLLNITGSQNLSGNLTLSGLTANSPLRTGVGGILTTGSTNLASEITGILPIANGGTNSSTALTGNKFMISSGSSIVESSALGDGQIFIGSTGNAPAVAYLTAGTNITITPSPGSIKIDASGEQPLSFSNGLTRSANAVSLGGALTANTSIDLGTYNLNFNGTGNFAISKFTTPGFIKNDASGNLSSVAGISLASDVSGTLPVANGGTGATSFTAGQLLTGNGTSPVTSLATVASSFLTTDASKNLQWTAVPGNGFLFNAGGSANQIAYYTGGNTVGGITSMTWISASGMLDLPTIRVSNASNAISFPNYTNPGTYRITYLSTTNGLSAFNPLTDGQLLIGRTGNIPSAATLTPGTNISITNGPGSITIASSGESPLTFKSPLSRVVDTVNVIFGGTGSAASVAHSDHTHSEYMRGNGSAGQIAVWGSADSLNSTDKIAIHSETGSEGIVDLSHQSRARVYLGTSQAIATALAATDAETDANWTAVGFGSSNFDEHSEMSAGTFTAKQAGYYQVNARVEFDLSGITGSASSFVSIAVFSGSSVVSRGSNLGINSNMLFNNAPTVSDVVYLTAGQTVSIRVFQFSGASLNVVPGTAKSYFSIHKIS